MAITQTTCHPQHCNTVCEAVSRGSNVTEVYAKSAHVNGVDEAVQARRNARSAQTTMHNVLKRQIHISTDRATTLKQIYEDVKAERVQPPVEDALADADLTTSRAQPEPIRVLLLGFDESDSRVEQFRASLGRGYVVGAENFVERDWVRMMRTARSTYTVGSEGGNTEGASGALEDSSSPGIPDSGDEETPDAAPAKKKKESNAEKMKRQPQVQSCPHLPSNVYKL